ncbi:hypothetical protein L6164_014406 [Bauhinia variegata]|uniref:Uncharacterized protein n=1 Tax=Bauhinia variegata TaxID=167791 RepID=A0ACB9NHS1_BAUVA|nr:hypothetical protein L6164_014406 [Bauhinia variegata]
MSQTIWEADKMLDVYIYDYLMKRNLHASASTFLAEGKVSTDPVAIDAPGSFLFEWWSVFWDIFIARTDEKHSEAATSYIKSQQIKAQEMQKQQEQEHQKPNQHQEMQMQLFLQRHAQQQQQQQLRSGTQLVSGCANLSSPIGSGPLMRQSHATASALATKMYGNSLKLALHRDAFSDATMKQKIGGNVGNLLDPNHASLLKAAAATTAVGQPPGQTLLGSPRGLPRNLQLVQNQNQQLPGSTQDMKNDTSPMMSPQAAVPEGSLIGIHGPNQVSSNLTLKGWPLAGLDQLRSGLLQQNTLMQSLQPFSQLSLQQQLMLQAQQNLASSSVDDLESTKLRMLLNNQNMGLGKDGQSNPVGDLVPNIGTPVQVNSPLLPHLDSNVLLKEQVQQNNQQQQQYLQHPLSRQQPPNHQRQDKMVGSSCITADGSISTTFQGNDQASKSHIGRKRKQASSSGPANSSGTANTTGPSTSSPSTPSTQTADVMAVPPLQQNVSSSKSLLMFNSDSLGSLTSAQNQTADMDRLMDGSVGDKVQSFLSSDDADPRDRVVHYQDVGKGISLKEMNLIVASTHKIECCHFSSDGKLLATGGHDRKASLWCTESFELKSTLEEHSQCITDVRFSPSMPRIATSSADKTVRIWDADNPGYSLRTFSGHSTAVMSLDFHPSKEDLIFSCDNNSEIRYWSVLNGSCAGVFKGGASHMRFQPCFGRLLAAAVDNLVSILDVETLVCRFKLQGHKNLVRSVCWDSSGEYLSSVSDDSVRVWKIGSGGKGECIHDMNASGNKFNTSVFHPSYPLLIIGCYDTLELWNFSENKTTTLRAHDKLVSSLAVSNATGLVASASHDKRIKFWK